MESGGLVSFFRIRNLKRKENVGTAFGRWNFALPTSSIRMVKIEDVDCVGTNMHAVLNGSP